MPAAGHISKLKARIHRDYARMSSECSLVTATDGKHAPYLFNAIASIHARFPDHPVIHVFDLGMNRLQRAEISSVPWIQLREMDRFVNHWKQNWSWKPYILTQVPERYVFYFDASNIVLYRSLVLWFRIIAKTGYLLIGNGQKMRETTPPEYWQLFGLDRARFVDAPTFGAGLMGFDREGFAGRAIDEVLARTIEGWNLGCSAGEIRRAYDRSIIRNCECFRADQTLFNLAFRKYSTGPLVLRNELKYCGIGGHADHPRQFLWYARRKRKGLMYFWIPLGKRNLVFFVNRLTAYVRIVITDCAIFLLRIWHQLKTSLAGSKWAREQ
jgi:hypothetical protein